LNSIESYKELNEKVILNVDDDSMNQLVMEKILEGAGVKTICVKNGAAAVRKLMEGFRPDAILMDLQMPVMGGVEASQKIRLWIDANVPIIINSGDITESDKETLNSLGIHDFLEKPYNQVDILETLQKNIVVVQD
jgi:CheY-like chemotaxis protein